MRPGAIRRFTIPHPDVEQHLRIAVSRQRPIDKSPGSEDEPGPARSQCMKPGTERPSTGRYWRRPFDDGEIFRAGRGRRGTARCTNNPSIVPAGVAVSRRIRDWRSVASPFFTASMLSASEAARPEPAARRTRIRLFVMETTRNSGGFRRLGERAFSPASFAVHACARGGRSFPRVFCHWHGLYRRFERTYLLSRTVVISW